MPAPRSIEVNDPCWKERQQTYNCLDQNNYDKQKCVAFFENGKRCKEFWHTIALDRRSKRIRPEIPYGEERDKVKEEYLKSYKKPTIHIKIQS